MSKSFLYLAGGIVLLLAIAGGYLFLSRPNNSATTYMPTTTQNVSPTSVPITTENADEALNQTEAELETELNQADEDIKAAQETSAGTISQEDLSSVNSL